VSGKSVTASSVQREIPAGCA